MLDVIGLSQGYRRRPVIHDLHLSLGTGVFGLLGPNGSGKSTLLRTLATTALPAHPGHLRLFGQPLDSRRAVRSARRRIGYLPQSFAHPPGFTVRDFVRHCAWLREVPAARINSAADEAIDRVELGDRADTPLRKLSGGMLRRAGVAQAICDQPDLVILDEPANGLDPQQRVRLRAVLRELSVSSCVLVSTHLVEDTTHLCDRVGVLYEGRLRFDGTPGELADRADEGGAGDTPLERGYTAALAAPPLPARASRSAAHGDTATRPGAS